MSFECICLWNLYDSFVFIFSFSLHFKPWNSLRGRVKPYTNSSHIRFHISRCTFGNVNVILDVKYRTLIAFPTSLITRAVKSFLYLFYVFIGIRIFNIGWTANPYVEFYIVHRISVGMRSTITNFLPTNSRCFYFHHEIAMSCRKILTALLII